MEAYISNVAHAAGPIPVHSTLRTTRLVPSVTTRLLLFGGKRFGRFQVPFNPEAKVSPAVKFLSIEKAYLPQAKSVL